MATTIMSPPPTDDTASTMLYGDTQIHELQCVYSTMQVPQFNTPPAKLDKARAAILTGRVALAEDGDTGAYDVIGSTGVVYRVTPEGCTCEAARFAPQDPYPCYHTVSVVLYERWQQALRPLATPVLVSKETPLTKTPPVCLAALPQVLPSTRRPIAAILADLSRPLPDACLGVFPRKNKKTGALMSVPFVPWTTVAALLDTYAPGWEGEITRVEKIGDKCAIFYKLTIHALEGPVSQYDGGMEDENYDDYGDAVTNAIATAFKRAAAKFGIGRDLYEKDTTAQPLASYLLAERKAALGKLGETLDRVHMPRSDAVRWLKNHTGATQRDTIPLLAITGLIAHLEAQL